MCHVEEGKIESMFFDEGYPAAQDSDKNHFRTLPREYHILANTGDMDEDQRERAGSDEDEDSSMRHQNRERATGIISPNFAGGSGTKN